MTTSLPIKPFAALLALGLVASLSAACKDATDPSQVAGQYGQAQGQYGQAQGQYGQYGQPPGQVGQPQGQYGQQQPTPQPTQAAPAASPFSLPCQSDATCGTHKCNLQVQRCAVPCTGPADCMAGASCMLGVCMPGLGGASQAR